VLLKLDLKEIRTEIEISSSSRRAWNILTDFSHYQEWNPVITQIIGEARIGDKLKISVKTNKGKTRIYRPTITKCEENLELRWKGRSILPGLLTGERIFRLDEKSKDRVRLLHSELFSGIAIVLAGDRLSSDVQNSLREMNIAFKNRIEQET
jgi:hypothetical protein